MKLQVENELIASKILLFSDVFHGSIKIQLLFLLTQMACVHKYAFKIVCLYDGADCGL